MKEGKRLKLKNTIDKGVVIGMDKRFGITHIVLAVFHKSELLKDSFDLALAIKNKIGTTFNTSPIILPGDGAPPEIPRVIFKSGNGIALTVSQKVTSLQLDVLAVASPDKILYDFLGIGNDVISLVVEDFESEIARLGVVLVGNLTLETTGAEFVKETYLKCCDEPLFGSEAHWLTHPVLGSENVNRWVRIKADTDLDGVSNKFVEIIIDSNTMYKPEHTVSRDNARHYIKMCFDDLHNNFDAIAKLI